MDTTTAFKLEVQSRKVRDMCSVLTSDEKTELLVEMYKNDFLKNEYVKTLLIGDFYGSTVSHQTSELSEQDAITMASWIVGGLG